MTTFIGAEYIIAYTLITKIQSGFDTATFQEVRDFGTKLQNELNKNNIDAVVISHSLPDVIEQFSEYFDIVVLNNCSYIKCKRGVYLSQLESRFLGYLPLNILSIVDDIIND